jgi:PKD repeat protein
VVTILGVLVLALVLPMIPARSAHAVAGDPGPCAGVDTGDCVPNSTTDDPSLFEPDPVTFPGGETVNPGTGDTEYPITLSVPGLPVCFTGFGGGIVNQPCYYNSYSAKKWYKPLADQPGWFSVATAGEFGPSSFPAGANGPSGTLFVQEGFAALFLIENVVTIHLGAPSFATIFSRSYGTIDTRVAQPPDPNQPPTAGFTVERIDPNDFGLYRYSSLASDPDPGDSITSQTWEFGDGDGAVGPTVIHVYDEPGSYTVKHRVVDGHGLAVTSSQVLEIPAPSLQVSLSLPDVELGRVAPGESTRVHVTVAAGGDGLGALENVAFVGDIVQSDPSGAVVIEAGPLPAVPADLTLDPGAAQEFDVLVRGEGSGAFTLSSTVEGIDVAGHHVGPVTGTVDGTLSGLVVELRSGATGQDTIDVVLTVRNEGSAPIEALRYSGNGVATHPEYVPDALRGDVTLVSGPSPALPNRLEPGETREARFQLRADAPGDVAVVAEVTGDVGGNLVTANDAGWIGAQRRALNAEQLKNILAELAQGELEYLQARAVAWQDAVSRTINARLVAARQQGLEGFPANNPALGALGGAAAGAPAPVAYPEIDNVQLTAAAIGGYAKGLGRGVVKVLDFTFGTPATYYASIVSTGDFSQMATDYADAGIAAKQSADNLAYGTFSTAMRAYDNFVASGQGELNQAQYTDLTEALNDEYKGQMLQYAAIAPQMQQQQAAFDAYLDQLEDEILRDPYTWADKVTGFAGEVAGETLTGEGLVRGGTKLAETAMTSYEYSRYGQSGAAVKRLSEAETLESLGAGKTTAANVETLGGITKTDQQKIDGVIKEVQEKFGVDLEIQARPSNVHSVQYLNSELGAVGKPEIFKAKNITDVDVILGADEKALGQLGVFEPHLPRKKVLDTMPDALANDVKLRYDTQKKVWKDWNDPESAFRQNYEKAAQPGGGTFDFQVPTAKGDLVPSAPRKYQIEVELSKPGRNGTRRFFEKTTGRPIVSDIDFHAYFQNGGKALDPGTRGQIELYLQQRWKETGIAFGDHGATLNGFDWAGSGTGGGAVARHKFGLEFMEPAAARARAEELGAQLGVPAEKLLEGYVPGKFVVTFRRGQVAVGYGKTF